MTDLTDYERMVVEPLRRQLAEARQERDGLREVARRARKAIDTDVGIGGEPDYYGACDAAEILDAALSDSEDQF